MKKKINYLIIIICIQLLSGCTNKDNIDPFLGEWTSYDNDLKISKVDTIYQIDYFNKSGQLYQTYQASKVGDLLSYRDNNGIGKQIQVYVPVNTIESKEGNIILDYNDSLNIRLMINDIDYYKLFDTKIEYGLKGFSGKWKTKNRKDNYAAMSIDSSSQGIQVSWIGDPDNIYNEFARFHEDLLNINAMGVDGGIYATYFPDCDCITIDDDKYYRYNENDEKFLGHWKNNNGEIKISKNGNYYLVLTHQYEDYTFTFLTEVKNNELQEPIDKYAQGKTYTTITYLSPGVISDDGGITKYHNSNKYVRSYDKSFNNTPSSSNSNQSIKTTAKTFTGNVGKLQASYNLTWNNDGSIYGTYYYPSRPNISYTLKGKDLGNGNIQLTEYTGSVVSANCNLKLKSNCYVGQMNNTDGRVFKMTICQ